MASVGKVGPHTLQVSQTLRTQEPGFPVRFPGLRLRIFMLRASRNPHLLLFPQDAVLLLLCVPCFRRISHSWKSLWVFGAVAVPAGGHPEPFGLPRLSAFQPREVGVGSIAPGGGVRSEDWVSFSYQSTNNQRTWTGGVNLPWGLVRTQGIFSNRNPGSRGVVSASSPGCTPELEP